MRQRQTFRGFMLMLLMLILIVTAVRFPYVGQADKVTSQDFIKILEDDQAADVSIHQNPQTPIGEVVLTLLDDQVKRLCASDVKNAQRLLDAHDMAYTITNVPQENYLVIVILPFMLSIAVVVIIITVMNRSTGGGDTNARMMNFGRSRTKMSRDGKINFFDVTSFVGEKEELEEVASFLRNPQRRISVGVRISKGLLLAGPPGTGKTLLARTMAGEAGVPPFPMSGSDFVEIFVGVGASHVRDLFEKAKKNSPCIVFIDEIDAAARRKGTGMGGSHDGREQMSSQLLVETDGFGVNEGTIIMAATNCVDILDPAILHPGRFDRKVAVGRPDVRGREEILKAHSEGEPPGEGVDLHKVVQTTLDFTRADPESLMNETAIISAKDNRRLIRQSDVDRASVGVGIGAGKKSKVISKRDRKVMAYHEVGHAILFHVFPDVGPVHIVSITPTEVGAVGYTMPLSERDEIFNVRDRMMQDIMADLSGRIAEELVFDDIITGASQDIKQATQIARAMVTQYGTSEKVGMIQHDDDENEVFVGRDLAHTKSHGNEVTDTIDSEVKQVIDGCYQKAKDIIKRYDYVLHACAALLIEKEKVSQSEFKALLTPAQQHLGPVFRAGSDGRQHQEGEGG